MAKKTRVRTRTMRVKSARRKKSGFTLPMAAVAGFAPAVGNIIAEAQGSGWERALKVQVPKSFMAYNPDNGKWGMEYLGQGLGPIALGMLVHWGVGGKLGVNKMLGRAKVPVFRI